MYFGVFEHIEACASHKRKSMPPPKQAFSSASRAKADKRNARLRESRAATAAPSGGAKSGKKKRKVIDLTEEEMPVYRRWIKFVSAGVRNGREDVL
jgi:hypothetical protein